jgi:dTDP-4-dehydrorhamnose 3,5-epimerase
MPFTFTRSSIPEVLIIDPHVFTDDRGFFMETYKRSEFATVGIPGVFSQCNHSTSSRGILRGLHFQNPPKAQGKLIRAIGGEIYDVAVDIRRGSPSFGRWTAVTLSAKSKRMLYVPAGFAHGFCVISDDAEVEYMTTEEYAPDLEAGIIWSDADLAIEWPIAEPILSARDRAWPRFNRVESKFRFDGPV